MLLMERLLHGDGLTEAQRLVAGWLLAHRDEAERLTCRQVAEAVGTSPTTVVRLSKACGYEGFDHLRREIAAESAYLNRNYRGVDVNSPFAPTDSALRVATKVCSLARETAEDTMALMDGEALEEAVALIDRARVVHMAAVSFPVLYAQDFQLKMNRVGKHVVVSSLVGEPLFTENLVREGDVAVVISYSGTTPATLDVARMYLRRSVPIIAITSLGTSELRSIADVCLSVTTRERLYSKVAGFTSELSIKLVLDTLYACYFNLHAPEAREAKDRVCAIAEPGRVSTSHILREPGMAGEA